MSMTSLIIVVDWIVSGWLFLGAASAVGTYILLRRRDALGVERRWNFAPIAPFIVASGPSLPTFALIYDRLSERTRQRIEAWIAGEEIKKEMD